MWMPHNASHLCATSKALTCCLPPTLGGPAHGKTENTPKVKEITFVDLTPPGLKIIFGFIGSFVEFMTSVASWFSCKFPCRSNNFVSLWMGCYLNNWTSQLHVNFDAGFSQPGPGAPRPPLESMSLAGGHGFWRTCLETRFTHGNLHMMSDVYSSGKCLVSKLDAVFCMENQPLTKNHRAWWRGSCHGHDISATWLLLKYG